MSLARSESLAFLSGTGACPVHVIDWPCTCRRLVDAVSVSLKHPKAWCALLQEQAHVERQAQQLYRLHLTRSAIHVWKQCRRSSKAATRVQRGSLCTVARDALQLWRIQQLHTETMQANILHAHRFASQHLMLRSFGAWQVVLQTHRRAQRLDDWADQHCKRRLQRRAWHAWQAVAKALRARKLASEEAKEELLCRSWAAWTNVTVHEKCALLASHAQLPNATLHSVVSDWLPAAAECNRPNKHACGVTATSRSASHSVSIPGCSTRCDWLTQNSTSNVLQAQARR